MIHLRVLSSLLGVIILTVLGCSRSADTPLATSPTNSLAALPGPIFEPSGAATEALGVFRLERDPSDPLNAQLILDRAAAAQGDLYDLSLRPFLGPEHLELLGSNVGPNDTTEYTVRFTHPFAMPADLAAPATAEKRVDLSVFDVTLVLVVEGDQSYFGEAVRTHLGALPSADGYRQLGPMVDLNALGIANGTNVFPYQLFTNADHTLNPAGNFDPANGWREEELLNPSGYDVIAQGHSAILEAQVANALPSIAVVLVAKYCDPRGGTTILEKRANRLPNPADLASLRYFLPEAAGDVQSIEVAVEGTLAEGNADATATAIARVLDWDHAATVAASFPNPADLTQISEASGPIDLAADFPQLQAAGPFTGSLGATSGLINEFIELTLPIQNTDQSYVVVNPEGDDVAGLLRVRDAQDTSAPTPYVLDENLVPQGLPPGFELSTRYQKISVHINGGPHVASVAPLTGRPGALLLFSASTFGSAPTAWSWDFGGGANPNLSSEPTPQVTLVASEGSFAGALTVSNANGIESFPFTLTVALPAPNLPPAPFNYANLPLPRHYSDPNYPPAVLATADNTPPGNAITDAGATLGRVLFYDVRLSANNTKACASCHQQTHAFSDPAQFSIGFDGGLTGRHSMALSNARYYDNGRMFWDERAATLEEQVLQPIQNEVEMGMSLDVLVPKLAATSFYPELFEEAFGDPSISPDRISRALAQFVRAMVSYRSKFDQAQSAGPNGTPNYQAVLTPQEFQGLALFGPPQPPLRTLNCAQCHDTSAQILGLAPGARGPGSPPGPFAVNNGLDLDTSTDQGAGDGRFKSPSLRNIEVSAPYMHDGRFATLDAVINFYAQGVQPHPNLHPLLRVNDQPGNPPERFTLTPQEQAALVAFLRTLTDQPLMTDPKYANPFPP